MNAQYESALALKKIANQHREDALAPLPAAAETPVLIEGTLTGRDLTVTMPNGDVWRYDLPADGGEKPRTLLVNIHLGSPAHASVFQPTCEGVHPFVGVANRYGVEKNETGRAA